LFDELLPVEVHQLPAELAVLDRLLADPRLLAPITQAWAQAAQRPGRPRIPMTSFVRLMSSSSAPAGATSRWWGRCRTGCTCAGSVCCR
jgi:hypothetical protein